MALNLKNSFVIKLILLSLALVSRSQQISALRLGQDTQNNDIEIVYSNQSYYVVFTEAFQYKDNEFTLCFRHRPVIDKSQTNCELGNSTGPFDCIYNSYGQIANQIWSINSDFSLLQDHVEIKTEIANQETVQYSFTFSLSGTILKTNRHFNLLSQPNTFYEVISASSPQVFLNSPADLRRNFVSTFYSSWPLNSTDSDNLLMQRQAVCFRQDKFYHLVFSGVVFRDGYEVYMQGLLSYESNQKNFKMWAGISYSKDHVNRDMVGIDHMFGSVYDLFSLYASAPYLDKSANILGIDNTIVMSAWNKDIYNTTWVYFTQFFREMQTDDPEGDETLRFKIKNQYCFVSQAFYSEQDLHLIDDELFLRKDHMHQYLNCFTPDLTLYQQCVRLQCLLLGIILIAFIL